MPLNKETKTFKVKILGFNYFYLNIIRSKQILLSLTYYQTLKHWNPAIKKYEYVAALGLCNKNMNILQYKNKYSLIYIVVNMDYLLFDNPNYKSCTFPLVK